MAAPPVVQPPPGNPRFPLLDAMRAIAVLAVVVYHTGGASKFNMDNPVGAYTARADVGVAIFFLLSGFLLYRPFVAARRQGAPRVRVRDYARRRLLRIVPAYWLSLVLLSLWPGLPQWDQYWWRFVSFTQIYWNGTILAGNGVAWSLCVEMSFYLVLPLLAAGLAGLVRGRSRSAALRVELALLAGLALLSIGMRAAVIATGAPPFYNVLLPMFMDWFAAGMALAAISVAFQGRENESRVLRLVARRPWVPWALAAVAYWVVATRLGLGTHPLPKWTTASYVGHHDLYGVCALFLLLPAVFGPVRHGWPRRVLATRGLAWLGIVSYGVFLYHGPVARQLVDEGAMGWIPGSNMLSLTVVTLAIAVTCAATSYYLLERPLLRLKDARPRGSRILRRRSAARASAGA